MTTNIQRNLFLKLLLDGFYSIFIVTNIVIFVWRSIWDLQDNYLLENKALNSWLSLLGSYFIIFIVKILQRRFYKQIRDTENNNYYIFTPTFDQNDYIDQNSMSSDDMIGHIELRIYIVLFAFANINHWRGIWYLTSYYTNDSYYGLLWIALVSFFILSMIKRVNSLISTPFQINNDCIEVAFKIQAENLRNYDNTGTYIYLPKWQYFINFIYEYITDVCTIQVWRSYWIFLDLNLFPNNQLYSALICLFSGILIYSIAYLLKAVLNKYLCAEIEKNNNNNNNFDNESIDSTKIFLINLKKLIILRIVILINFIGVVNIWRGLWLIQTLIVYRPFFTFTIKSIICLTSICISLILLLVINRVSAILSRGNCKDEVYFMKNKYIVIEPVSDTLISIKNENLNFFSYLKKRVQKSNTFVNLKRQDSAGVKIINKLESDDNEIYNEILKKPASSSNNTSLTSSLRSNSNTTSDDYLI